MLEQTTKGLFEEHLRIIRSDTTRDPDEALRIAEFKRLLKHPLRLRPTGLSWTLDWLINSPMVLSMTAVAASLAVGLFYFLKPSADFQMKGAHKVFVIVEQMGKKAIWNREQPIENGTRVSAEIRATEAIVAFLGVYDDSGKLLISPAQISSNTLVMKAGDLAHFREGFELAGRNEGETLAVVACERKELDREFGKYDAFVEKYLAHAKGLDENGLPSYCNREIFKLRS